MHEKTYIYLDQVKFSSVNKIKINLIFSCEKCRIKNKQKLQSVILHVIAAS